MIPTLSLVNESGRQQGAITLHLTHNMISTLPKHPHGAPVGAQELEEQDDMIIVSIYGDVLIVDDEVGGRYFRKEWARRDDRPAAFALNVDGQWYEFVKGVDRA